MFVQNKSSLLDEYGYPESNPISELSMKESLEERYDITETENDHYREDLAGAALIDQEILSKIEGSNFQELQWAMNQEYSPSVGRMAGKATAMGFGLFALATNSDVFFDEALNIRDIAGGGVAASTMMIGYSLKGNFDMIGEYMSELPETLDNCSSIAEYSFSEAKPSDDPRLDEITALRTTEKYADEEVRDQVDFPSIFDVDEEALDDLSREMEKVYQEAQMEENN